MGATDRESDVVIRQVRQTTWPEVQRLFNTGLAGFWSMAVYLVVGFAACHITGPSVVMSVVITAITSVLTGKQIHKSKVIKYVSRKIQMLTTSCRIFIIIHPGF